jgi:hypothetical protein
VPGGSAIDAAVHELEALFASLGKRLQTTYAYELQLYLETYGPILTPQVRDKLRQELAVVTQEDGHHRVSV